MRLKYCTRKYDVDMNNLTWFKYYPHETSLQLLPVISFKIPPLRRQINLKVPFENIKKDEWIFVDIKNLEINKIYDQSFAPNYEDHSYVVVYQSKTNRR